MRAYLDTHRSVNTPRIALPLAFLVLVISAGCPLRPKTEETDDAAEESGGREADEQGAAPGTSETGETEPTTCEQELKKVKAALEACEAPS